MEEIVREVGRVIGDVKEEEGRGCERGRDRRETGYRGSAKGRERKRDGRGE